MTDDSVDRSKNHRGASKADERACRLKNKRRYARDDERACRLKREEMAVKTDRKSGRLKHRERIACLAGALFLTMLISFLFYRSYWAMAMLVVIYPAVRKEYKWSVGQRVRQEVCSQFLECIRIVAGDLQAGYSPEHAFAEAERELTRLLGKEAVMVNELKYMNQKTRLNLPLEKQIEEMALRHGIEDMSSFAQVFGYAKRSGGDFIGIIKETAQRISSKQEVSAEIQTLMAAKCLEQRVMNVIPMGILLLVNLGSPGFLDIMYETLFGRAAMSICLAVYAGAYFLSKNIVKIEV